MNYIIYNQTELIPCFKYAKRLLEETNKPIVVVVSKKKQKRSINQNSYYWGVVLKLIGDELGYFVEDMHKTFATMFLKQIIKIGDEEIETYKSTTKLKTDEFEEYLQKIRMFASSELDIIIPLPNEIIDND